MPARAATVEVRMYNVGFGDAFRIIVRRGDQTWRMLVDCGVHSHGDRRPIGESVARIIEELETECDGKPSLDVVVATHHHADHISGFAENAWKKVEVGEVWVPFVEHPDDQDAKKLRKGQAAAARKLVAAVGARRQKAVAEDDPAAVEMLDAAMGFAVNSGRNEVAMDRLLSRNDRTTFLNRPKVRYLPDKRKAQNRIEIDKCGAVAHILGPPRDPDLIKKMNPPANAGWLTFDLDDDTDGDVATPRKPFALFNGDYIVRQTKVPRALLTANNELDLGTLTNDAGLLAAASILERSVNNTSVFFVLDVDGTRFLFPGDAQYGAWEHVRNDPKTLELIKSVDFYKVGHHGSHNATPKEFVENEWGIPGDAMVPWGMVKQWRKTIPKKELINSLKKHKHRVIQPEKVIEPVTPPRGRRPQLVNGGEWWKQLNFTTRG